MKTSYYLYRLNKEGSGEIYGEFDSLFGAKMSASLLKIEDKSFILSGDLNRIYFCDESGVWDYDLLTDVGKKELFYIYPNPKEYKRSYNA